MAEQPGRAAARTRRSTLREVAEPAGASSATVSRILSGTYPASPATRGELMRAVKELGYVAGVHARALSGAPRKSIAIIVIRSSRTSSHQKMPICGYG